MTQRSGHSFDPFPDNGRVLYRHNEIWRDVIDRRTGNRVGKEFIKRNRALVEYVPDGTGRD